MDEKNFIIKIYQYINGELQLLVKEFEAIEEAIEHGMKCFCHRFKIFDRDGHVCHDSHGHENHDCYY
jgi:hypothetical protein